MLSKTAATIIDVVFQHPDTKTWRGSDPRLDFPEGHFTGDNWNDGRLSLLRRLVGHLEIGCAIEVDWNGENGHIFRCHVEDQSYVFIRVQDGPAYDIQWYKDRGATSIVRKNGSPVTLEQLRELIEQLAEVFSQVRLSA